MWDQINRLDITTKKVSPYNTLCSSHSSLQLTYNTTLFYASPFQSGYTFLYLGLTHQSFFISLPHWLDDLTQYISHFASLRAFCFTISASYKLWGLSCTVQNPYSVSGGRVHAVRRAYFWMVCEKSGHRRCSFIYTQVNYLRLTLLSHPTCSYSYLVALKTWKSSLQIWSEMFKCLQETKLCVKTSMKNQFKLCPHHPLGDCFSFVNLVHFYVLFKVPDKGTLHSNDTEGVLAIEVYFQEGTLTVINIYSSPAFSSPWD